MSKVKAIKDKNGSPLSFVCPGFTLNFYNLFENPSLFATPMDDPRIDFITKHGKRSYRYHHVGNNTVIFKSDSDETLMIFPAVRNNYAYQLRDQLFLNNTSDILPKQYKAFPIPNIVYLKLLEFLMPSPATKIFPVMGSEFTIKKFLILNSSLVQFTTEEGYMVTIFKGQGHHIKKILPNDKAVFVGLSKINTNWFRFIKYQYKL